ncbi:lipopolysaccharide biosynthesis protein [Nostoc sp. UCD121]|uniref:lipopolysaccharide biosynthesis protein n=1 Tax=unclassified Nostoc TaxID=2593658 RepID=UPI001627F82F|nr:MULTISPECIES: lipopolysaccharide biosynthesis protein [unclassified Nostoc]MBC1220729.1 lipopolysaccharide biosynthesis protein [Nostoc sp. UCD120]MBC1280933.1 lipopolysaccharide biosynthesis protein [Nostoc sp. UCD121]MBC1299089.1 lipopolysaccharide biosynthesis protein [Nostoc sp. UCD122]
MNWIQTLQKRLFQDRFIRNIGWMGAAELVIRVFRLVTTVILARFLSAEDYGLAAIVLMTNEFIRVFTRNGIADKIVQADASDIEELCRTAYGLNWLIAGVLFTVQCLASLAIAQFYNNSHLILPICLIAITYLVYPLAMVQTALIRRENRLNILALITSVQVSTDNVLTAIFALSGMGMWAIILPKFLVAPIWIILTFKYQPWRMTQSFTFAKGRQITSFASRVLGIELLTIFRENVDYLLIGRFLGVQALGVYYFAFNAGLGLSLSVINAIRVSLFSDLCDLNSQVTLFADRYMQSLRKIALMIVPLVVLQSSLAPFYVPLIFGHKWVEQGAVSILIVICCSALSRPFADAASLMFRAFGQPQIELRWNLLFTGFLAIAIWLGTQWGILGAAVAVMVTHLTLQPLYTIWATRQILPKFLQELKG